MNEAQLVCLCAALALLCLLSLIALACQLWQARPSRQDSAWMEQTLQAMDDPETLRRRRLGIERL